MRGQVVDEDSSAGRLNRLSCSAQRAPDPSAAAPASASVGLGRDDVARPAPRRGRRRRGRSRRRPPAVVGEQHLFDLAGMDQLAAAVDHVVGAAERGQLPSTSSWPRSPVSSQPSVELSCPAADVSGDDVISPDTSTCPPRATPTVRRRRLARHRRPGPARRRGFLFLAGRADDVINRGGELVYPREIEEVLLADRGSARPSSSGCPTTSWARSGRLPRRPSRPTPRPNWSAIWSSAVSEAEPVQAAGLAAVVDDLPRAATGKILRHRVVRTGQGAAGDERSGRHVHEVDVVRVLRSPA